MPDHFHVITDGEKKPSVIQRFINGITSRRDDVAQKYQALARTESRATPEVINVVVL